MKILTLEKDFPGSSGKIPARELRAEAARVWELYLSGDIREAYFRKDRSLAVLVLECSGEREARRVLSSLPLVRAGRIDSKSSLLSLIRVSPGCSPRRARLEG